MGHDREKKCAVPVSQLDDLQPCAADQSGELRLEITLPGHHGPVMIRIENRHRGGIEQKQASRPENAANLLEHVDPVLRINGIQDIGGVYDIEASVPERQTADVAAGYVPEAALPAIGQRGGAEVHAGDLPISAVKDDVPPGAAAGVQDPEPRSRLAAFPQALRQDHPQVQKPPVPVFNGKGVAIHVLFH